MLLAKNKTLCVCAEDMVGEVVVPPARKLEDLIRLADLCVDLLRQNEEFYAEVGGGGFGVRRCCFCCR